MRRSDDWRSAPRGNPEDVLANRILDRFGALPGLLVVRNVVKKIPSPFGPGWLEFGLGVGTPDLVGSIEFAPKLARACGWELKVPGKKSKPHQEEVANAWRALGWFVAEIHSEEEFGASLERARQGAFA